MRIFIILSSMVAVLVFFTISAVAQTPPPALTVDSLESALKDRRSDKDALAERVRAWFGADNLKKGAYPKIADLKVAFAVEIATPDEKIEPIVAYDDGKMLTMRRLGKSNVWAVVTTFPEGAFAAWRYRYGATAMATGDLETYVYPPETHMQPNVPKGELRPMPSWKSTIFAGTTRDWWIYIPAQYKAENPVCVMVFQDGGGAKNYMPVVLDNMIAKGEIPVMAAIFINPGNFDDKRSNRSFEYDTLSDQYARFLLEEMLPEAEKSVKLKHDANSRAVAGLSSGGICAFTAAWQRPNEFGKVLSWIGSFVNLQGGPTGIGGGHNYPTLIRQSKSNPKPIRVFLQDGANDLDNPFGNWPLANQGMAKALAYSGYDYKFVFGSGNHSDRHGRAILPDSLRWLWRDYKEPVK